MGGFMNVLFTVLKWIAIIVGGLLGIIVIGSVLLPPLTRSATDRWGATDAEVSSAMTGDDIVPQADAVSTKAITINARPELVYALLVQIGYKRGGWYAWDWFYNATGSSDFVDGHHTMRVDPALQRLAVGDKIYINAPVSYDVAEVTRPTTLLLKGGADGSGMGGQSWLWAVRPIDDGEHTRLVLRIRADNSEYEGFVRWLFEKPLDMGGAIMGYKTLYGIKRTAEELERNGVAVNAEGEQVAGPTGDRGVGSR